MRYSYNDIELNSLDSDDLDFQEQGSNPELNVSINTDYHLDEDTFSFDELEDVDYIDQSTFVQGSSSGFYNDVKLVDSVESTLASFIRDKRHSDLSIGFGNTSMSVAGVDSVFRANYARALEINPALSYYASLAELLGEDNFYVNEDNELSINMTKESFDTHIKPNLGKFSSKYSSDSPICVAINNIAELVEEKEAIDADNRVADSSVVNKNIDINQVTQDDLNISLNQVDTAELVVDYNNEMGMPEVVQNRNFNEISLHAVSNAVVVDYLLEEGYDTEDEIRERLQRERFSRAKIREIIAIYNYRKLNKSRRSFQASNEDGNVFDFEI